MSLDLLDLKDIIIKILSKSPKHGYDLSKEISNNLQMKPSLGGLYPILKALKIKGFIKSNEVIESGRLKKIYSLTTKGQEELKSIEERFKHIKNFMDA